MNYIKGTYYCLAKMCVKLSPSFWPIFILHLALNYTDKLSAFRLVLCVPPPPPPPIADLFLFCFEIHFTMSLSGEKQAEIIEAFNSTSRYLDDLLKTDDIPRATSCGVYISQLMRSARVSSHRSK